MHGGGSCEGDKEGDADTPELGLENVGGVFLVLGLGLMSAMVLGCTEFLWNVKTVAIEEKVSSSGLIKAADLSLFSDSIYHVEHEL